MDEGRSFTRRHLIYYLIINDSITHEKIGFVGDISGEGILIISENKWWAMNKKYKINIVLPKEIKEKYSKRYIEAEIETKWKKTDKNPKLFCIGTKFLKIDDLDVEIINETIDTHGFSDHL